MTILDLTVGTCTDSLKIKKKCILCDTKFKYPNEYYLNLITNNIYVDVTTNYVIFNLMKNDNRSKQCAYYINH